MKLLGNYAWLAGAEMATKALTFVAFAHIARVAGPQGFGGLEFAANILLFAGLVVELGLGPYGAREIARHPASLPAVVGEIITARIGLALAAVAGVLLIALAASPTTAVTRYLMILSLSLIGMPLLLQWVFQGLDQMGVVAASNVIRWVAFSALVFVWLRDTRHLWVVPAAEVLGVAAAAAFTVVIYRRRFAAAPRPGWPVSGRLFREGGAIGLGQAFWAVRMYGGVVLLGWIATQSDAGYFAAAQRILVAAHSFVYLYYFNLLPSLSRTWQQGARSFRSLMDGSMRLVLPGSAVAGVAWILLAPTLTPLVYGSAFSPATRTLQWLAGVCVIAAIDGHYRYGLIAAGRQSIEMAIQAVAAVLAMALLAAGYQRFGISGAAAGLVAAEVFVCAASWYCLRRTGSPTPFEVVVVEPPVRVPS